MKPKILKFLKEEWLLKIIYLFLIGFLVALSTFLMSTLMSHTDGKNQIMTEKPTHNLTTDKADNQNIISKDEAGKIVLNTFKKTFYIQMANMGLPIGKVDARVKDIKDYGNYFYNVTITVPFKGQERDLNIIITKDGNYIITSLVPTVKQFNEDEFLKELKKQFEIPKSKIVNVTLAVMGDCPFGNIAEINFKDIYEKYKDRIRLKPVYIIYPGVNHYNPNETVEVNGKKYWSLHGNYELTVDLYEYTVYKLYDPEKWIDYVVLNDKECLSKKEKRNIEFLTQCLENNAKKLGLDIEKIKDYLNKNRDKIIEEEFNESFMKGIQASPTILINGKLYRGGTDKQSLENTIKNTIIE
jgi:hypothetical protein